MSNEVVIDSELLNEVDSIGVMYIEVQGKKLPCSSVRLNMSINKGTDARVAVPMGNGIIKNFDSTEVADIVKDIQSANGDNGSYTLTPCKIYEEGRVESTKDAETPTLIFKGYITQCAIQYNARFNSVAQVVFVARGVEVQLLACPVSGYIDATYAIISNLIAYRNRKDPSAIVTVADMSVPKNLGNPKDRVTLLGKFPEANKADIATRLAICYQIMMEYKNGDTAISGELKDNLVDQIFFSKYTLSPHINEDSSRKYNEIMLGTMHMSLGRKNLLSSIIGMLNSESMLLHVVPRWKGGNYKLEILPNTAWSPELKIKLDSGSVTGFSMEVDAEASTTNPDVAIVNFDSASGLFGGGGDFAGMGDIKGIAGFNTELVDKLRESVHNKTNILGGEDNSGAKYRVLEYNAPSWLLEGVLANKSVSVAIPPETLDDEDDINKTTKEDNAKISQSANQLADSLAQALFLDMFMDSSCAHVSLSTGLRFGGYQNFALEDHLGDTIHISIGGRGDDVIVKHNIDVEGVLSGLTFEYSAGRQANVNYYAKLDRVRLSTTKVPNIPCPIYTKIAGQEQEKNSKEE